MIQPSDNRGTWRIITDGESPLMAQAYKERTRMNTYLGRRVLHVRSTKHRKKESNKSSPLLFTIHPFAVPLHYIRMCGSNANPQAILCGKKMGQYRLHVMSYLTRLA